MSPSARIAFDELSDLVAGAVQRINSGAGQRILERRVTELPPADSRHLTDTRTRVANLLEYMLGLEINQVLHERQTGQSCSAVLWNVFPDLLIRDSAATPIAGLEVKALHAAAEEKSANLSTPLSVIQRDSDFIIVMLWAWSAPTPSRATTYPEILDVGVFFAWDLAWIRDIGWLSGQNNRPKGIDLAFPVLRADGDKYKAEEGNLGKLLRIGLEDDILATSGIQERTRETHRQFRSFVERVVMWGVEATFIDICQRMCLGNPDLAHLDIYPTTFQVLGRAGSAGEDLALLVGPWAMSRLATQRAELTGATRIVWLGAKLNWRVLRADGNSWSLVGSGSKPDSEILSIIRLLEA